LSAECKRVAKFVLHIALTEVTKINDRNCILSNWNDRNL
jgi:hypothetical protein